MKECDILGGVKTLWPSYIFSEGHDPPTPHELRPYQWCVYTCCVGKVEVDQSERDGLSGLDLDQPRTLGGPSARLLGDNARQQTSLTTHDDGSTTAGRVRTFH